MNLQQKLHKAAKRNDLTTGECMYVRVCVCVSVDVGVC